VYIVLYTILFIHPPGSILPGEKKDKQYWFEAAQGAHSAVGRAAYLPEKLINQQKSVKIKRTEKEEEEKEVNSIR